MCCAYVLRIHFLVCILILFIFSYSFTAETGLCLCVSLICSSSKHVLLSTKGIVLIPPILNRR